MKNSRFSSLMSIVAMAGLMASAAVHAATNTGRAAKAGKTRAGSRTRQEDGRKYRTSTQWFGRVPVGGGAREVARRKRQMAKGMLKPNC